MQSTKPNQEVESLRLWLTLVHNTRIRFCYFISAVFQVLERKRETSFTLNERPNETECSAECNTLAQQRDESFIEWTFMPRYGKFVYVICVYGHREWESEREIVWYGGSTVAAAAAIIDVWRKRHIKLKYMLTHTMNACATWNAMVFYSHWSRMQYSL